VEATHEYIGMHWES